MYVRVCERTLKSNLTIFLFIFVHEHGTAVDTYPKQSLLFCIHISFNATILLSDHHCFS